LIGSNFQTTRFNIQTIGFLI